MNLLRLSKIFLKVLFVLLILLAISLGILRSFFPYLDQYRPALENWATQSLHQPVKISKFHAGWKYLGPIVDLGKVTIFDETGHHKRLTIQNLQISVSLIKSLLHRHIVLSDVIISGTDLSIRHSDNNWDINGIKISSDLKTSQGNTQEMLGRLNQITVNDMDLDWDNVLNVKGLDGQIHITPTSGNIQLKGPRLALHFKKMFTRPLVFNQYSGHFKWAIHEEGWNFSSDDWHISNSNLNVYGDVKLFVPKDNSSPIIKLHANISEKDVSHLRDYVPVGALKPALSEWLQKAFVAGDSIEGNVLLQGPLSHFPFADHTGEFQVLAHLNNITLNYGENWPPINHIMGQVLFSGKSMKINISDASIFDIKMDPIQAEIPDFSHAELIIKGSTHTDMAQALKFLEHSPLKKDFAGLLENVELKGKMQLNIGLQIPFYVGSGPLQVKGEVTIDPNTILSLPKGGIDLTNLAGKFNFTQNSVFADNLSAQWLGRPLYIKINTKASSPNNSSINVQITGHVPLALLVTKYDLHSLSDSIKGETDYTAVVKIINNRGKNRTVFSVDSNLKGISIDLPKPLAKSATEKIPTHVEMALDDTSDLLDIKLKYAKKLNAIATLEKNTDSWFITVNSPIAVGDIFIPKDLSTQPIDVEFKQLYLKSGATKEVSRVKPGNVPPLKLHFQNLYYDDRLLGSVLLITSPQKNAMQIQKLTLSTPKFQAVANGQWKEFSPGHQQTTLSGNLNSSEIGSVLKGWGLTDSVKGGRGKATFNFSWPGAAHDFAMSKLNGNFALSFGSGRIINISQSSAAEMGIGRVLNLLSLQTLPRRLSFDFSDLTQKGFSFDKVSGDFSLKNGDVFTDNAYLNGPIAKVQVKGRIGLGAKDYNLKMMITPYLTSSLPVAATLAGGPVVGAAAWVANKVFGGVVNNIVMHEYQVTGSWDSPLISKLQ